MKTVCCICGKVLKDGPDEPVSHGHCEPCNTKWLWMAGVGEQEITDLNIRLSAEEGKK